MLFSILFVIILFALITPLFDYCWQLFEVVLAGFIVAVGFAVLLLMSGLFSTVEYKTENHVVEISSIRDQHTLSGSFFLGSGAIDSKEHYYMFAKNKDGGYYRFNVPSNKSTIYMKDGEAPRVEWVRSYYKPHWLISFINVGMHKDSNYTVIVPEGTIVEKFELN